MSPHLPTAQQGFNHYDSKYQACCNNGHALNVAKTICVIELAMSLMSVAWEAGAGGLTWLGGSIRDNATALYTSNGIMVLFCCVTLTGLYRHNKGCVLAGAIYRGVMSAVVAGAGIYVIAELIVHANEMYGDYSGVLVKRYLFTLGSTFALCTAVCVWMCLVHVAAYRYLADAWRAGTYPLGHAHCELVYASGGVLAYGNRHQQSAADPPTQVRATSFELQAEQPPKY